MYYYEGLEEKPIATNGYNYFKEFATDHSESWKRILQHIYTHDPNEGIKMYEKIKRAVFLLESKGGTNSIEGNKLFAEFMLQYYRAKRLQTSLTAPNFGVCEYCLNVLDQFPKVKKHKKFFKKADPKMWNLFEQHERSIGKKKR